MYLTFAFASSLSPHCIDIVREIPRTWHAYCALDCAVFVRVLFAPSFKQAHTDAPECRLAGQLSRYCIKPRPIRRTDVRRKYSIDNSLLRDDELGSLEPHPL